MSNYKQKIFFVVMILVTCIICSSCISTDFTKNNNEELIYRAGKNVQNYEYSNKVLVTISDHYSDAVSLNNGFDDYSTEKENNFCILTGRFDEVAWYNYKLFINIKGVYYCLDIKDYEVPNTATVPTDNYGDIDYTNMKPKYKMDKYSEKDMMKLYPDYKNYNWYGH